MVPPWTGRLAGAALTVRGALGIAAGSAQARLDPQVTYEIELEVFGATTAVRLEAFDDSSFAEELERAADRGMRAAVDIVARTVDLLTGVVGLAATAVAIALVEPLLLPLLILAGIPSAVTSSGLPAGSTWPCWPGSPGTDGCGCSAG